MAKIIPASNKSESATTPSLKQAQIRLPYAVLIDQRMAESILASGAFLTGLPFL